MTEEEEEEEEESNEEEEEEEKRNVLLHSTSEKPRYNNTSFLHVRTVCTVRHTPPWTCSNFEETKRE